MKPTSTAGFALAVTLQALTTMVRASALSAVQATQLHYDIGVECVLAKFMSRMHCE